MRAVRVIDLLSLDGVMQAPGHPDEDREGGFEHGGWAVPFQDDVLRTTAVESLAHTDTYLFGRKTYEAMASYWPNAPADDPFARSLNNTPKYVASTTLREATWRNSTVIEGDVATAVAELKERPGKNIAVLGSGALVQTLIANDLVDEYFLAIYPIVLGSGKRLFRDADYVRRLELVESRPTTTGGLMLTYQPVR